MHVAHPLGEAGEVEQQRRGNVVGQVSHQPHARRKRGEVELQRIAAVHHQPLVRKFGAKSRRQIAVDLYRLQPAHALE